MKNKTEINIVYKYYIPEEWITDLEKQFKSQEVLLTKTKDEEDYYNFTGPELSNIIIYIKDNPESIFLAPALYDILKTSVVILWNKLKNITAKRGVSQNENELKTKKISIRVKDSRKRVIEINIEGNIKDELIESVVDKYLKTNEKEKIFKQPDLVDNSYDEQRIELKYNPETNTWEPENFGKIRKAMDDFLKLSDEDYEQSN
jgi:hypothetical protein